MTVPKDQSTSRRPRTQKSCTIIVLLLLGIETWALAFPPGIELENAEIVGCPTRPHVRAYASDLRRNGVLQRFSATSYQIEINETRLSSPPTEHTSFANTKRDLEIVVVIQNDLSFRPDFPRINAALKVLFHRLPSRAHVTLITYGAKTITHLSGGTPTNAESATDQIRARGSQKRDLLVALRTAQAAFSHPPESRRILIALSDGVDPKWSRAAFRNIGDQLRLAKVTLHPIAFSPIDERAPLLNLGELAKRTRGTFRWAKTASDLRSQFEYLADEIRDQMVLTFPAPNTCDGTHQIRIARENIRSMPRTATLVAGSSTKNLGFGWQFWGGSILLLGAAILTFRLTPIFRGLQLRPKSPSHPR